MKVKFKSTGNVVDFVQADWLFAFIEAGLVTQVHEVKQKPVKGVAEWFTEGRRKDARVTVHCPVCRQTGAWFDATGNITFQHCGKTELIPVNIFTEYQAKRNTW